MRGSTKWFGFDYYLYIAMKLSGNNGVFTESVKLSHRLDTLHRNKQGEANKGRKKKPMALSLSF